MKNATFSLALLIVFGACEISATFAQLPQTRLASLFPPGAQQGTTADVTLTAGTDLDEVDQLIFSNPGIRAVQKVDGAGNPIASVFTVTVDPGVAPGLYDARARGLFGISNPRIFRVDTLPETAEVEPNNAVEQATVVKLNSVVSGRSDAATDVDFYRLTMEAGQTVVFRCEAARIDSAMQPELQLFNAAGRRLAQARRMFSQDASLVYTADQAGDVVLRIADIVYGGGSDFVYRLAVDSRPLVDLMVPSIVSREQATTVTLFGRYLPDGQPSDLKIDGVALLQKQFVVEPNTVSSTGVGFAAFSSPLSSVWWSGVDGNLLPVSFTAGAAVHEQETAAAQMLAVPGDVQGSFAAKGDEDEYRFQATKGETWIIEVFGHRLGGITDPLLLVERVIPGADGAAETYARLGTEDDQKQNPGGNDLPTLSADPAFQLAVPEDGIYRIRVRDQYSDSRGDPRLTYRLSVRKPEPDFQLVVFDAYASADGVAPATSGAVSLRRGGSYQLMVYAYRQDGHDGAIRVEAGQLPEGISCQGAVIGPGQVSATLVLAAAENCSQLASPIQVLGRSGTDAAEQVRTARVATLVHDALNGLPRTARISDSLVVGVMKDEQPFTVVVDPVVADISQDQQLLLPVRIIRRTGFDGKVDLTFLGLPANVDAPAFFIDKGSDRTVARLFFKDNAPPSASTIVVSGLAPVPYRRNPWLAERAAQKVKDAEALVAARQQLVTEAAAAAEGAQKTVAGLNEQIASLMKEVEAYTAKKLELQTQFAAALTGYKASIDQLGRVKDQLAAVTTTKDGTPESFDAALKAVTEATAAAEEATKNIATLTAQAEEVSGLLAMAKEMETGKASEKAASEAKLPDLMKAVETAQAALAAAQKMVEQTQAEKAAADEALKKAEEAAKPNNLNLRTVSAPVIVNLHSAPAKVVSAALEGNTVRKGASAPVKVTLARKNGFAGPLKVALVVPDGFVGLTSDSVDVAADQTEVTLTITAAADAAVADVPHAVIRASGDFSGRAASVDIPFAIKVIE